MSETFTYCGGCHCGNVSLKFTTCVTPGDTTVRACDCSFCRKHGLRAVSDPEGGVDIRVRDASELSRYRFGHRSADFLVCRRCGVYVAALIEVDGERYATLNVNALEEAEAFMQPPQPVNYDDETLQERTERRRAKWTPVKYFAGNE